MERSGHSIPDTELYLDLDTILRRYKSFEDHLIDYTQEYNFIKNPLYEILSSYLNVRCKIDERSRLKETEKKINDESESLWNKEHLQYALRGECGDKKVVYKTLQSEFAYCNEEKLESIEELLEESRKQLFETFMLDIYEAIHLKTEIELTVQDLIDKANSEYPDTCSENYQYIQSSRLGISVFFCYLRKNLQNKIFVQHVRNWLLRLATLQLKSSSTLEDHWFLLFHLLRCPSQLSWGIPMIQIPKYTLKENQVFSVNLSLSLLCVLFSPVNKRNIYLQEQINAFRGLTYGPSKDAWIVVESDGDEECTSPAEYTGLKENDLIGLLNQIPFERIFRFILRIDEDGDKVGDVNEKQFLNVLSFNSKLIKLLSFGLSNFGAGRYSHFIKRVGLLMKQCIHYTYDYYLLFLERNLNNHVQRERFNITFDEFILMCCQSLYHFRQFGISQFFQFIPYGVLHKATLYAIFYYLNVGFPENFCNRSDYKTLIEDAHFLKATAGKMNDIEEEELHYLVQTFFEMAISRDGSTDMDFIQIATKHIFFIGCLNEATRLVCYKSCRDILVSLTSVHPKLMCDVINITYLNLSSIEYFDDMIKSLPLYLWLPDFSTLETLSQWLREYSCNTKQSMLARIILERMNWSFNSEGKLFLPRDIHVYVACIINEAFSRHRAKYAGRKSLIERLSTVSLFESPEGADEDFIRWCWNFITTLHLHFLDQGKNVAELMMKNPAKFLLSVPDLNEIDLVSRGVFEMQPLSLLLAIGITKCGHSIPLICQQGFDYLYELFVNQNYIIVIRYLELLTVMFTDYQETLINNKRFNQLMCELIESNKVKFKDGSALELLANMLQSQILSYNGYGLSTPDILVKYWFEILLGLSSCKITGIIYLLDRILTAVYSTPSAWRSGKDVLRFYFEKCSYKSNKIVVRQEFYKYPWYCLCALEVEHELYEIKNNLWPAFLLQFKTDSTMKADTAFKEAVKNIDAYQKCIEDLTIFKYADIIVNIDHKDQILPILAQHFFFLYLYRIQWNFDEERYKNYFGVSNKIYEYDIGLMNQIDSQFKLAEEYYTHWGQSPKKVNICAHNIQYELSRLFKAYSIWLKEASISKISDIDSLNLPTCFLPEDLRNILLYQKECRIKLLDDIVKTEVIEVVQKYLRHCRRNKICEHKESLITIKPPMKPLDRIQNNLRSYDKPQVAICLTGCASINASKYDMKEVLKLVNANLKVFDTCSMKIDAHSEECKRLNKSYIKALQDLYYNVSQHKKEYVKCSSLFVNPLHKCSKPAEISVTVKKYIKNLTIENFISKNRVDYHKIINSTFPLTLDEASVAFENLQFVIKQITTAYCSLPDELKENSVFSKMCEGILFQLITGYNKNILHCFPSRKGLKVLLFILNVSTEEYWYKQVPRILQAALKDSILFSILSDMVHPSKTKFEGFIDVYEILADAPSKPVEPNVVLEVVIKFDVEFCLKNFQPKDEDVLRILKSILKSISKWHENMTFLAVYRKHLMCIFEHQFPKYCSKILEGLLILCSSQSMHSNVLLDIVNTLLGHDLDEIICDIYLHVQQFAKKQNLLDSKNTIEIILLFTNFFHKERMKYALNGLYTFYEHYCENLSILFAIFGHSALISCFNNTSDESNAFVIFETLDSVMGLYTPWICIYNDCNNINKSDECHNQKQAQRTSFYPWKEHQQSLARYMCKSLITTLKFCTHMDEYRTAAASIYFNWYINNFANNTTPIYIKSLIIDGVICFPWDYFLPSKEQLEALRQIVLEGLNKNKNFLFCIFSQTPWNTWYSERFNIWNFEAQTSSLNNIFTIIIKLTIGSGIDKEDLVKHFVKETTHFPWSYISYEILDVVFHWITSMNSSLVSRLVLDENDICTSVLSLIKSASSMNQCSQNNTNYNVQAKRLLYVRNLLTLLVLHVSRNQSLSTMQKLPSVKVNNFFFDLMKDIENITSDMTTSKSEAMNLISEVLRNLAAEDETSKFMLTCIDLWLSQCSKCIHTKILIFDTIAQKAVFNENHYKLLESNTSLWLGQTDSTHIDQRYTWTFIVDLLGESIKNIDISAVLQARCLLVLHILIIYKINVDEMSQLFLSELTNTLGTIQPSFDNEDKFVIIWGALICAEYRYIQTDEKALIDLLQFGLYIQKLVKDSETWSSTLLGMVGLQQGRPSQKFLLFARCLSCLLFSICARNDLFSAGVGELKTLINSRRNVEHKEILVEFDKRITANRSIVENYNMIFDTICLFYNEPIVKSTRNAWT